MKLHARKIFRILSFTGMLFATASISSHAAEYVCVNKDGVNVRTGPNTSNPVYMELFEGYPLKILAKQGEWYKVQDFEKDSGWIFAPLTQECKTVIVNVASSANMRAEPSTSSIVVAVIERGVVLDLLKRQGKWVNVRHSSGRQGWIYSPLVWP